MAGLFDTQNPQEMTPGSAVADTLQNILANRRAVAHQQMLDQIQAANVKSEMQYRQQQAETNQMYRQAWADQRSALAKEEAAKAQGLQDQAANRQKMADFIKNEMTSPQFANLDPNVQEAFRMASANPDDKMMGAIFNHMLTAPKPGADGGWYYKLDRNGNPVKTDIWLNKGDVVKQEPAPPPVPTPLPIEGTQDGNPSMVAMTHNGTIITPQFPKGFIPAGRFGTVAQNNPASTRNRGHISDTTMARFISANQALATNPNNKENARARDQLANQIITEYKPQNPSISQAVQAAWAKTKGAISADEVVERIKKTSGLQQLPPQDEQDFRSMWGILSGK